MLSVIRYMAVLYSVLLLIIANCTSGDDIAGSVTETGNVTGVVMSSDKHKAANAKVSLFKKKSEVMSPDEQTKPVEEVYTNDTGYFSFKADAGNFTIIAVSDSEYAFRDSIAPGNAGSRNMVIELRNPGKIKGVIKNSIELRGTGSVVVHLIGTSIYKNVDSDGSFLIDNVPAGTYTLVSYSTYQPEFSPKYLTVNVFSDSTTDLGGYSLTYNGIPIPKNVVVKYDTSNEEVRITWDSVGNYKDFQEYAIYRGIAGTAQHNLVQIGYTEGTTFIDPVQFTTDSLLKYEYSVLVNNKLGESGKYYGIYTISCVPKYRIRVSAGEDQFVDISTNVILQGTVGSLKYPVKKMEWRLDDNDWFAVDSGKLEFSTNSNYNTEKIVCVYRVTDTMGNIGMDTVVITKQQLEVTLGKLPLGSSSIASTTVIGSNFAEKDEKLWMISCGTETNKKIWSSTDAKNWNVENSASAITTNGELLVCDKSYYYLNPCSKSYRSNDFNSWEEINNGLILNNNVPVCFCVHKGKMYGIYKNFINEKGPDTLVTSQDAVVWTKSEISISDSPSKLVSFRNNLYLIAYDNEDKMWKSNDDGLTWENTKMWDDDFDMYPDNCMRLMANDSVMVAIYAENPGNSVRCSVLISDRWYGLSQSVLNSWTWDTYSILFQNRLLKFKKTDSGIITSAVKVY